MKHLFISATGVLVMLASLGAWPVYSQNGSEPALPEDRIVIAIDAPQRQVFRIGIPDLFGQPSQYTTAAADVLRNDFRLMPNYRVIGPDTVPRNTVTKSLEVQPGMWSSFGANGVIKGHVQPRGANIEVHLRFYQIPGSDRVAFERTYRGKPESLRASMHDFGNHVLRVLTGKLGPFGTSLVYGRRRGPGQKQIWAAGMDGHGLRRVSPGSGVSMLPAFGKGAIWYTRMTSRGTFITHHGASGRPVIRGAGLNMGPAECDGRIFFASSRDGDSEIYSAARDGSNVRRLTRNRSIDVSPSCGPSGKLAFVSNRHGSPQIFTMNQDGSNVRRVTFKGNYNQTPSWCRDPATPLIAFTGRDGGLDIFTVNIETQEYNRITQGTGESKDPAFSRDCRVIAFASTRRGAPGVYLASPEGFDQVRVIEGRAETVRWSR